MCGICGYIDFKNTLDPSFLQPMISSLRQRGPDDTGIYTDERVGLAHSRLSIIDISTGHQPITSEDDEIIVIQNGEFYNFTECRNELQAKGHVFKTRSDAEVLVHLYEEKGFDAIRHIHGMFAFALYDKRKKILFLGRDRMGQKPLYYLVNPDVFVFGSEPKAVRSHPASAGSMNSRALMKYFFYDYIPGKETMFSSLFKLSAGCSLVVDIERRSYKENMYWDIPLFEKKPALSFEERKKSLFFHLEKAVEKRLRSDVPVGIFLSGGIDSSIISYLMKRLSHQKNLHSFSIGYKENSYDESFYSRLMSDEVKTKHHHFILTEHAARETLQKIKDYLDEPFADPSLVPTYFLSEKARQHVKVVLGGDGGDELFAGYQGFHLLKILSFFRKGRPSFNFFLKAVLPFLYSSESYSSWNYMGKKLQHSFSLPNPLTQVMSLFGSFSLDELSRLTGFHLQNIQDIVLEDIEKNIMLRKDEDEVSLLQYNLARLYLRDGVLVKVDRASMANSLEVRSPFLDHDLVEYAFRQIPHFEKFRRYRVKYILKETFKKVIPQPIIGRPKQGFAMPLSRWLRSAFQEEIEKYLNSSDISRQGLLNPDYVEAIKKEHLDNKDDHRKKLWAVLMFQYWMEKFQ
ncbi:MAG: asparagine synthase (glutamine-hydrolyzing) [Candidatus Aureabacteria bacterium]|nr:asparagine synthase (glutamine-hydrolyzing) [Candidatus Auribacterota bacterium]